MGATSAALRPQERVVVSALALYAPEAASVDRLAELLWDAPPATSRKALQNHILRIRQSVGPELIDTLPHGYRIGESIVVDVVEFPLERQKALALADPHSRARELSVLLESSRGEAFADLPDAPVVIASRAEHHEQWIQTEEDLAVALLEAGNAPDAVSLLKRLVIEEPFREYRWWMFTVALYRAGQRRDALQGLAEARRVLAQRVGLDPGHDLEELESRILADDAALLDIPIDARPRQYLPPELVEAERDRSPFVGRVDELATLRRAWSEVVGSTVRRVVVIEGEAGAGKTRLAAETARAAHQQGATVVWGRCSANAGISYQPVVEALGRALAATPALLDRLGGQAAALVTVLPELERRTLSAAPGLGTEDDRARLFRVVGAAFAEMARRPLVWVIDDLQWATDDTLTLLGQVVIALVDRPVLMVVTSRAGARTVAGALADWQRAADAHTIRLGGLDVEDLGKLLSEHGSPSGLPVASTARTLHERTNGNAFFVTELLAAHAATRRGEFDPTSIPTTLGTWIERRRDALPLEAAELLSLAAVIGSDVDVELLRTCSGLAGPAYLAAGERLLGERFLEEHPPDRLRFVHSLVHDVIYDTMTELRRAWLHRAVGEALETQPSPSPVILADHFSRSGPAGRDKTHRYALEAARLSLGQGAWIGARQQSELAYEWARDADGRSAALIVRGQAQRALGEMSAARASLESALDLARGRDLGRRVAEGVLALVGGGGRGVATDTPDAGRAELLREALARLGDVDDELAVLVLGELALALLLTDQVEERRTLAQRAIDMARRGGNPTVLARALLTGRLVRMGPEDLDFRLADLGEILSLPDHILPTETVIAALLARHEDYLAAGDRSAARRDLADVTSLAEEFGHPYWSWAVHSWRTLDAIIDGQLEEAEMRAFAAVAWQPEHPEVVACLGVNLVDIRLYQNRPGEMLDLLAEAVDQNPHIPTYRAVLALCCLEDGDEGRAREAYRHFADPLFTGVPLDTNRLLALTVLAHVAGRLGNAAERAALARQLAPWAGQQAILNCFAGGGAYWGPVDHALALLEEPGPERTRFLERAAASAVRFGAPLALARIERDR